MDNKVGELLQSLSDKLGTTADHLYKVLVKQAKIDAIVSLVSLVFQGLFFPVAWVLWKHLLPYCVSQNPGSQYSFEREWPVEIQLCAVFLALGTIGLLISFIISAFSALDTASKGIFNPEASAVEKILNSLSK